MLFVAAVADAVASDAVAFDGGIAPPRPPTTTTEEDDDDDDDDGSCARRPDLLAARDIEAPPLVVSIANDNEDTGTMNRRGSSSAIERTSLAAIIALIIFVESGARPSGTSLFIVP